MVFFFPPELLLTPYGFSLPDFAEGCLLQSCAMFFPSLAFPKEPLLPAGAVSACSLSQLGTAALGFSPSSSALPLEVFVVVSEHPNLEPVAGEEFGSSAVPGRRTRGCGCPGTAALAAPAGYSRAEQTRLGESCREEPLPCPGALDRLCLVLPDPSQARSLSLLLEQSVAFPSPGSFPSCSHVFPSSAFPRLNRLSAFHSLQTAGFGDSQLPGVGSRCQNDALRGRGSSRAQVSGGRSTGMGNPHVGAFPSLGKMFLFFSGKMHRASQTRPNPRI